ncbi:MAG: HU family DNA-binding protein [Leptolyngbya sp. SIO4C5]|nr:HU family DNA-binding protein [Leptolyngbya sp. SIO4C5]
MNKAELVGAIADRIDGTTKKNIDLILSEAIAVVQEQVAAGNKIILVGFGSFEPKHRKERLGRNPKTGDEMTIPAQTIPHFSPGKTFKQQVRDASDTHGKN